MPSTERWLLIHTSTPAPISSRAISAWISENPIAKSGFNFRISPILALVNAETFGFSLRARGGRTVKPEMPTMRSCSPSAYSTSQGSSVKQTIRSGPRINPPWCVATARPSLAVRSPARDAIQGISRKPRLTFGEADDAARIRRHDQRSAAREPSLVRGARRTLPGAALAGARCDSTHLASNPGSPLRARRPHREAGNADDAVLLAERVQHLARFFRQANDPLRSAHKPSLVCRYGPALPGAALAGARCHSTHLASNPGSPLRARGGRTVKPEMPTMRSCSPSAYSTSQGSSVKQTIRSGPRINPPWCV